MKRTNRDHAGALTSPPPPATGHNMLDALIQAADSDPWIHAT